MHAEPGRLSEPVGECDVEQLDEHLADVTPYPLVEHADEEPTPALRRHRPLRHLVAVGHAVLAGPLHDGDELDELAAAVVAQEPVDVHRVRLVGGVDGGERVPLHAVLAQRLDAAHDLVEHRLAGLVAPVGVVQLARPVDAEADEEPVLQEEPGPLVVDLGPVGLDGVDDVLPRLGVLLAQLHRPAEELHAHQHGLAALPGDVDLRRAVRLDELADVQVQRLVAHPRLGVGVQPLLAQEVAVGAVEVARRARRFDQQVERRRQRCGEVTEGGRFTHGRLWYLKRKARDGAAPSRAFQRSAGSSGGEEAQRPRRLARRFMPARDTGESGRPNGSMNTEQALPLSGSEPSSTSML